MGRSYTWFTQPRLSIRGLLLLTALIFVAVGVGQRPDWALYVAVLMLVAVPVGLSYAVLNGEGLTAIFRGPSCPACAARALARVAVVSFGPRYYRCTVCGAHWKRWFLTVDLEEAKESRDHERLSRRSKENPWMFDTSDDEGQIGLGSKTIDELVASQRRRAPEETEAKELS